jgi:hypothetical protein
VKTEDGKEFVVDVNNNTRLIAGTNAVSHRMKIPMGLGEMWIERKEIDEFRTMNEMDVVEGNVLSFHLCPLADLILKKNYLIVTYFTRNMKLTRNSHIFLKSLIRISRKLSIRDEKCL